MAIIAANWKMHFNSKQAVSLAREFKKIRTKNKIIVFAPYTALNALNKILKNSKINLGAQNLFYEKEGAFTGEISTKMVKEFCSYVLIGHSERRRYFNESNQLLNKKLKAALKAGLKPVYCIGETFEQREMAETTDVLKRQLSIGLKEIDARKVLIAYEPVWAIGTGKTATPELAEEVHKFIKSFSGPVKVLYGGSVTPQNVKELMEMPSIDGALVGGASLKAKSFEKIAKC